MKCDHRETVAAYVGGGMYIIRCKTCDYVTIGDNRDDS